MQSFRLFDEQLQEITLEEGFPKAYETSFGMPGTLKLHAYFGKYPLLFQVIKIGLYEIAISDYLTRKSSKITCYADDQCIELHFILSGEALYNLKEMGWVGVKKSSYNLIVMKEIKNEVYFKSTPLTTLDIHFGEKHFIKLVKKYPVLTPLLDALNKGQCKALFAVPAITTPRMLSLIISIKEALRNVNMDKTEILASIEQLLLLVLENLPIRTIYNYSYNDIEKLRLAHKRIAAYVEEQDILKNQISKSGLQPEKFREGFRLVFGLLPGDFLRNKKLEKAHKLVTEERVTRIEDLAQLCGYLSKSYLSKIYLKKYGIKLSVPMEAIRRKKRFTP